MCGIGSITVSSKATHDYDLQKGAEALLLELDSRGKDACGIMALDADSKLHVQKAAVRAKEFIAGMELIPADTVCVAVHTRFATKGAKEWMKNNHPVSDGDAHIIHNGVVDDSQVERSPGAPQVDTYAISAALSEAGTRNQGETPRRYAKRVGEALAQVDGSMAVVAAFDGSPYMLTMKLNGSPLFFAEADGVRIAASTRKAVEEAADAMELDLPAEKREITTTIKGKTSTRVEFYEKIDTAQEGRVLSWQDGAHNRLMIDVPERTFKKNWRTSGSSYGSNYDWSKNKASTGKQTSYAGQHDNYAYRVTETGAPTAFMGGYYRNGKFVTWQSKQHKEELATKNLRTPLSFDNPYPEVRAATVEYPAGTPKMGSAEGESIARLFSFWRATNHGLKWARAWPAAAHSYDQAAKRCKEHGKPPPFPTPKELKAMADDPLTFKEDGAENPRQAHEESGDRCFVGDSCGVVTVADSAEQTWDDWVTRKEGDYDASMSEIVARMLRNTEAEQEKEWRRCDLCNFECDDVDDYVDGALCGDCARIWAFSDPEPMGRRHPHAHE